MLGLCDPSNLLLEYSFYTPRSDALFSNYFEDLLYVWHSRSDVMVVSVGRLVGLSVVSRKGGGDPDAVWGVGSGEPKVPCIR